MFVPPYNVWNDITTTDTSTVLFPQPTEAIYVGGTGDIVVVNKQGISSTYKSAVSGSILPLGGIVRVAATGTTATNLKRLNTN